MELHYDAGEITTKNIRDKIAHVENSLQVYTVTHGTSSAHNSFVPEDKMQNFFV